MKLKTAYIQELFYCLTAGLACFIVLELLQPGIVIAYLNLNYWLILWALNGILLVYLKK